MGPAVITALLHGELPGGTFAGLESGAFLHLIDLTKACHAGGHEPVPGGGREHAIALALAAAAAPELLALGSVSSQVISDVHICMAISSHTLFPPFKHHSPDLRCSLLLTQLSLQEEWKALVPFTADPPQTPRSGFIPTQVLFQHQVPPG